MKVSSSDLKNHHYEVQIEYEQQCMLNCLHCSSLCLREKSKKRYCEDDLVKMLNVFNVPTQVYLSGGEPLLNASLCSTIGLLKQNDNVSVGLFTSGITLDSQGMTSMNYTQAKQLYESGLSDCYISLYHREPHIHNLITGCDSYQQTLITLKNFIDVGIQVKIHLVINKTNYCEINDIIQAFEKLGVSEVRVLAMVNAGSASKNWDKIGVPYNDQINAIKEVLINKHSCIRVTISGFPDLTPCRSFHGAVKCQAGINLLYVTYDGDVFPCACTKELSQCRIASIYEPEIVKQYLESHSGITCNDKCLNSPFS